MEISTAPLDVAGLDPRTGEVPEKRVATVDAARSIYDTIWTSDLGSSKNRSLVDAMFGGAPPFNPDDLVEIGQSERTNIDFGIAAALKDQALSQYYDLTASVPMLARVQTSYGTPEQQVEWNGIISEEFHRTLTEWTEFEFNHQLLSDQFVSHGVGVAYFEDETDWRYRVTGLNEFKIPRGTKASEAEIEVATVEREYLAHQLYAFIRNPEVAEELGWNVDMVKQALMHACLATPTPYLADWEKLEVELKNNDLLYGNSKAKRVKVVHMWVQEFSGKVSHMIFLKDPLPADTGYGEANEEFLYEKFERFDAPSRCFVTFTYGIGNGCYHGIRGLGFKIYPHIQLINRMRCGMSDGALLSSALIVQPSDASTRSLEDLTLSYFGPYALFPNGLKIVDKAIPDFRANMMPVLADMTQTLQNNTVGFQSHAITPEGQARTAFEVRAQLQQQATLSSASINLFYHPWKRLLREVFRRLSRRDSSMLEPGGKEAVDFKKRCLARGVPTEAIYHVTQVDPVRAVGSGSPGMRSMVLQQMMSMYGSLDQEGQAHLLRDNIAALVGQEAVARYARPIDQPLRPPIDDKIAVIENSVMSHGTSVPVSAGEDDFIHAGRHLQALDELDQALGQGQADPQASLMAMQAFMPHTAEHVQRLGQDKLRSGQIGLMRQRLQQLGATAKRLEDQLRAQQINAQKAQQAEAQRQQEAQAAQIHALQQKAAEADALSPKLRQQILESQAKMQMEAQRHQQEMALKQAEVSQKLALRDAETAAKVKAAGKPAVPTTVPMAQPEEQL